MKTLLTWFDEQRGRRRDLAVRLGIQPGNFPQWRRVPAERVLQIERFTGIPRHELRPDLYPPESNDAKTAKV